MPEPLTPNSWREFFDAHAPHYLRNPFTRYTLAEVRFLTELFGLAPGAAILDMGCGTGRHAVELARLGYRITGVDLSEGMLEQARLAAKSAGVEVELVCADATAWRREGAFDAAICLCEGGFGLIGPEEDAEQHDYALLENVARSLKPGAPFVLTGLNGYQIIRQMKDENVVQGSFDPATMIAHYRDEWDLPEGRREVNIRERLFIPPEVVAMLTRAGFEVRNVWGGTAGEWGERPVKLDEIEVMYVCRKR